MKKVFKNRAAKEDILCADVQALLSREITKRARLRLFTQDDYECPVCGTELNEGNYCPFCGQHIVLPVSEED